MDLPSSTYQTLPRPAPLGVTRSTEPALPPRRQEVQFHVGRFQAAWRLLLWFYAAAHFGLGVLLDKLRHRDSEASRFTERDTPIFVGRHVTIREALAALDGSSARVEFS